MKYCNFSELIEKNKQKKPKTMAVVCAKELETINSVCKTFQEGYVKPIFIGERQTISRSLERNGFSESKFEIYSAKTEAECLTITATLIRNKKVDLIMKDQVQTGHLMKLFTDKKNKFLTGDVMSHLAFNYLPCYHKLLCITDTSLNLYPTLATKEALINNAVRVMKNMGFDLPKVAVLAAVEYKNEKMKETMDGDSLKQLYLEGRIKDCIVEGPISLDLAMDRHAAEIKNYQSPVAGDADLLVVPDLVSGNLLGKAFNYMPGSEFAGFVTGACVPIVLTSRASDENNKYLSILLATMAQ